MENYCCPFPQWAGNFKLQQSTLRSKLRKNFLTLRRAGQWDKLPKEIVEAFNERLDNLRIGHCTFVQSVELDWPLRSLPALWF